MNTQMILELIGYAASLVIASSLMMKSLIRLRILNAAGALVFVVYGILIQAYPIAILNGFIVFIDIYYLIIMLRRSDYFTLMEVQPQSAYLDFFLNFHSEDILTFFPKFTYQPQSEDMIFFILRDTIPAGLVLLRKENDKGVVLLDYAMKNYRDFKIGAFIFDDNADILLNRGINSLETIGVVPAHIHYLQLMGFKQQPDGLYHKALSHHIIQDQKI